MQFILGELILCHELLKKKQYAPLLNPAPCIIPFDLCCEQSPLIKLKEHVSLLKIVYSTKAPTNFFELVEQAIKDPYNIAIPPLFEALKPFLLDCKDDENLLLFLLDRHKKIAEMDGSSSLKSFLLQMHPEGLESLRSYLHNRYQERKFTSFLSKFDVMISELESGHAQS